MTDYAENQKHGTSPQGSGYEYVHGQVRRKAENATGENRYVRRRTGGSERNSEKYDLGLGVGSKKAANGRYTSYFSRISRSYSPYSDTPEINFGTFSQKHRLVNIPLLHNTDLCVIMSPVIQNCGGHRTTSSSAPQVLVSQQIGTGLFYVNI